MGFHEDDRIRSKNSSYTHEGITSDEIRLVLDEASVSGVVELLTNNGYRVKLKSNRVINISRNKPDEEKANGSNRCVGII